MTPPCRLAPTFLAMTLPNSPVLPKLRGALYDIPMIGSTCLDAVDKTRLAPFIEIGSLAARKMPLHHVYRCLHAILARHLCAANAFVAVLEGEDRLRFPYYVDEKGAEDPLAIFPREGLTAHVLDRNTIVCASRDPGLLDRVSFIGERPEDWVGAPLRGRDGRPEGILCVQTYAAGSRYSDADLCLLEFAAEQLSVAIQLQHLDRDLATRKIEALEDRLTDLDTLYAGIHEIVTDLIPSARDCFIIARVDLAAVRFRPVFWRDLRDDWDNIDWPMDRGVSAYIYNESRHSFVYEKDVTVLPASLKGIGSMPAYWLGVPIWRGEDIIGIVIVQSYDDGEPITREDEAIMNSIAPCIASAITRTELFERTMQR